MKAPSEASAYSNAARAAALRAMPSGVAADVLAAAHDPALGLDRSVCLRDVVDALRAVPLKGAVMGPTPADYADWLAERFGNGAR